MLHSLESDRLLHEAEVGKILSVKVSTLRRWRWAGEGRDFDLARRRVRERLIEIGPEANHRATYVCVLSVAWPDARIRTVRGETLGTLVWPIRGDLGYGFEPMFLPDGYAVTYGEMTPEHRLRVNARAAAMRKLEERVFGLSSST